MTTEIPKWAYDYLRTQLSPETELVNAVLLERGRYKGSVLANTTRGAVLVTKSSIGEPRATFLALPGTIVAAKCPSCGQSTELHNVPAPLDVHCSRCGAKIRVVATSSRTTTARETKAPTPTVEKK